MIKYDSRDFLFIASRLFVLKTALLTQSDLRAMAFSRSTDEVYAILQEKGFLSEHTGYGETGVENAIRMRLQSAYLDVLNSSPLPELFSFFTYPHDCNNLKTAIKCEIRGISAEGLLVPYGTVSISEVTEAVRTRDFTVFPSAMAGAASKAIETYAKSRSPSEIDLIIDRALFEDLRTSISQNPVKLFKDAFTAKADALNVMTAARIIKLHAPQSLFERAFLEGGELTVPFFTALFNKEKDSALRSHILPKGYRELIETAFNEDGDLEKAENIAYRLSADRISSDRTLSLGAESVAEYIASAETEAKNVRLLVTGKKLSLSGEKLFERLCLSYV